jgi:hypothetical protein
MWRLDILFAISKTRFPQKKIVSYMLSKKSKIFLLCVISSGLFIVEMTENQSYRQAYP